MTQFLQNDQECFLCEQSCVERSAEKTVLGWLGWPRASPEVSRLKPYLWDWILLDCRWEDLGRGWGQCWQERWQGPIPWAFLLRWTMQANYRLENTIWDMCWHVKKRWLPWFFSSQSHLKPFYFQIDLSCWCGCLLIALSGFVPLPLPSRRGWGNIAGVIKSNKDNSACSECVTFYV